MDPIQREILRTTLRVQLNRKLADLRRIRSDLVELKNRIEKKLKEEQSSLNEKNR